MVLWGRSVLGAPEGSTEGSTKVFHQTSRVQHGSTSSSSFVVSLVLCRMVPRKVPPRLHRGFTRVPPRLRKFRGVSGLLGQFAWAAKRFCGRFPHHFFKLVQFLILFFAFFLNNVSFAVFSHSKDLGAKWHVCFLGFFAANGFRLPEGSLERSPNSSLHWSHSLLWFLGAWLLLQKGSVEGSANYSLHLSPKWLLLQKSCLEGSANCALHLPPSVLLGSTPLIYTNPVRRKRSIMSLLLGYSLGLFIVSSFCIQISIQYAGWLMLCIYCMIIASTCTCRLCWGKSGMIANINASCKMSWDRRCSQVMVTLWFSSSVTVSRNSYFIPRNELTLQSLSSTEVHSIAIFVVLLHRALLPSKPRGTWMLDPLESLDISGDFEI